MTNYVTQKTWKAEKKKAKTTHNKCNVAFWTILTTQCKLQEQSDFIICCSYNKKNTVCLNIRFKCSYELCELRLSHQKNDPDEFDKLR